jgi:hypothetical protein
MPRHVCIANAAARIRQRFRWESKPVVFGQPGNRPLPADPGASCSADKESPLHGTPLESQQGVFIFISKCFMVKMGHSV